MKPRCPNVLEVRPGEHECRLSGVSISPDCGRSNDEWEEVCIPIKSLAWLAGTLDIETISDPREVEAIMNTARVIQESAAAGSEEQAAEAAAQAEKPGRVRLEGLTEEQLDSLILRAKEIKRRASGGRKLLPRIQAYRHALEREVAEKAQLIDLLMRAIEAIEAGRIPPKLPPIPRTLTPEERARRSEAMQQRRAAMSPAQHTAVSEQMAKARAAKAQRRKAAA